MAVFYSSWISCFPGVFLGYFLNDFDMVPVAPIIYHICIITVVVIIIIIVFIIIIITSDARG
jgi:hypothetical protein